MEADFIFQAAGNNKSIAAVFGRKPHSGTAKAARGFGPDAVTGR
jgi:hypothetical protein